MRAGVSHGQIEPVEDADGTVNATGPCMNIAARLAASDLNPGVVYDLPYADHVRALLRGSHFLHPKKRVTIAVKGKRDELFPCFADPEFQPRAESQIRDEGNAPFVNAVLLAYDLPGFSDGDLRTLASRFRDVSLQVQQLRAQNAFPGAEVTLSPGGDGGVLAITQIPHARALAVATELADMLDDASELRAAKASVHSRIGIHYGQMQAYMNAEGVMRPTGLALFEADKLAGDEEARRWDAVVISGALIDRQSSRHREIGAFTTAHGTAIRRFVPSNARLTPVPTPHVVQPVAPPPRNLVWPSKLKGTEHRELCDAIRTALPTREALANTLKARLDMHLDEIAAPGNMVNTVFALVSDAEAKGYTARLFDAVIADVPENAELLAIAEKRRA